MEDAAVNRLAKSITQLTLCQVTTDEVDAATKLLDNACQKLRGIPDVPFQRITDLEAAIRQMRQLSCIFDSCTISSSYEVSQAQKAILLMPRTAKGASTSSEELNAQMSPLWRPDGSVGMALVFPALTDCRWWFESLLVHSGSQVRPAERQRAPTTKKAQMSPLTDDEHNLPAHEDYWQEH